MSGSDNIFRLELQVKNLPGAVTGSFPIRLQSETGWREADALVLKEGNGKWSGSAAENILRAEIILSDEKGYGAKASLPRRKSGCRKYRSPRERFRRPLKCGKRRRQSEEREK